MLLGWLGSLCTAVASPLAGTDVCVSDSPWRTHHRHHRHQCYHRDQQDNALRKVCLLLCNPLAQHAQPTLPKQGGASAECLIFGSSECPRFASPKCWTIRGSNGGPNGRRASHSPKCVELEFSEVRNRKTSPKIIPEEDVPFLTRMVCCSRCIQGGGGLHTFLPPPHYRKG